MHTDEQYGRQLGVQLRREMEEVHAAPDLVWKLRRRQARRTWAIRTAIVTPVVVAAAAAILVTTSGHGALDRGRQTNAAQSTNSPGQLENVAYVQAQSTTTSGQWWTDHVTDTRPPFLAPNITDADSIRKAITDGTVELVGNETVDGLDTLHLRLYGPERRYRIDMWVDASTYLPIQATAAKSSGTTGPQEFPASATVTTKYSWLPRTKENLAHLVLTPPPGFEREVTRGVALLARPRFSSRNHPLQAQSARTPRRSSSRCVTH